MYLDLTPRQNLELYADLHGLADARERIDAGLDRVHRTWEFGKQRIARSIDHSSMSRDNVFAHDVSIFGQSDQRGLLIITHQTGIADNVRTQDRRELPMDVGIDHVASLAKDELSDRGSSALLLSVFGET